MGFCKLDGCENILPAGRRKYCSDKCMDRFFALRVIAAKAEERKKLREKDIRVCKYELCNKKLPTTANNLKKYCFGTDCYGKQNQLEAKRRRENRNKDIGKSKQVCKNDNCELIVEGDYRRKYCSDKCRIDQVKTNEDLKLQTEANIYKKTKENALKKNGNKKKIGVRKKFLVRGNPTYQGYGQSLSRDR